MDPTLEQFQFIWQGAGEYGVKLLLALIIWFAGTTVAKLAGDSVQRVLRMRRDIDPSVGNFAARAIRWTGLVVIVVMVLNVFGVNTTSIAAVMGAMTLAIGFALRDTLANVASGIMILVMRPFLTGHFVEIGDITGRVKSINVFNTEIATVDNIQNLVPNKVVWESPIKNFSAYPERRLDMTIGVDYRTDLDQAIRIVRRLVEADQRALMQPEPFVKVTGLGESAIDLTVRVWCRASDLHEFRFDLTKAIKERFARESISIPYPHMEIVHKKWVGTRHAKCSFRATGLSPAAIFVRPSNRHLFAAFGRLGPFKEEPCDAWLVPIGLRMVLPVDVCCCGIRPDNELSVSRFRCQCQGGSRYRFGSWPVAWPVRGRKSYSRMDRHLSG